jgi:hypothetical protein
MKALCCAACGAVTSPPRTGEWRFCDCQTAAMRWTDTVAGLTEVWTSFPYYTWVLDLDNMMLTLEQEQVAHAGSADLDLGWQKVHEAAVQVSPPDSLFHLRGCWAVLVKPGETEDVKVVTERPENTDG